MMQEKTTPNVEKIRIMILYRYLKANKIPAKRFAQNMGVHSETIYRSMKGSQRLSPDNAVKVEKITNGEVTRLEAMWPEDFDGVDDGN